MIAHEEIPTAEGGMRFRKLPDVIVFDRRLSNGAFRTYAVLQYHWWKFGRCYASHELLAAELGCSVRTLRRYLDELISAGWILEERRHRYSQAKMYRPTGLEMQQLPFDPARAAVAEAYSGGESPPDANVCEQAPASAGSLPQVAADFRAGKLPPHPTPAPSHPTPAPTDKTPASSHPTPASDRRRTTEEEQSEIDGVCKENQTQTGEENPEGIALADKTFEGGAGAPSGANAPSPAKNTPTPEEISKETEATSGQADGRGHLTLAPGSGPAFDLARAARVEPLLLAFDRLALSIPALPLAELRAAEALLQDFEPSVIAECWKDIANAKPGDVLGGSRPSFTYLAGRNRLRHWMRFREVAAARSEGLAADATATECAVAAGER